MAAHSANRFDSLRPVGWAGCQSQMLRFDEVRARSVLFGGAQFRRASSGQPKTVTRKEVIDHIEKLGDPGKTGDWYDPFKGGPTVELSKNFNTVNDGAVCEATVYGSHQSLEIKPGFLLGIEVISIDISENKDVFFVEPSNEVDLFGAKGTATIEEYFKRIGRALR